MAEGNAENEKILVSVRKFMLCNFLCKLLFFFGEKNVKHYFISARAFFYHTLLKSTKVLKERVFCNVLCLFLRFFFYINITTLERVFCANFLAGAGSFSDWGRESTILASISAPFGTLDAYNLINIGKLSLKCLANSYFWHGYSIKL